MSSIIMRNGGKRKNKNTQIYTWGACILVVVFLLSLTAAVKGNKQKNDSQEAYRKQAFDLGKMPFSDDEAEKYLLASARYEDIAKNDFINGLFSSKQREARQLADITQGVPAAPDAEYKAAQEEVAVKKSKNKKKNVRVNSPAPVVRTNKGQLSGSSGSGSFGGASRGAAGSTGYYNDNRAQNSKNMQQQAALLAQVKGGRDTGFQQAAQLSARAANAKDMNAAAAGAAEAFQDGAKKESKEFLESENEKNAAALEVDEEDLKDKLEKAGNSEELDKLDTKLNDKKKEKDNESEKTCAEDPFANAGCVVGQLLDIGKTVLGAYLGSLF